MKRLPALLFATALLLPGSAASAQDSYSLNGGLNLSIFRQFFTDSVIPVERVRTTGPYLGLAAGFRLTPPEWNNQASVQLSAAYSRKGSVVRLGDQIVTRLHYLELAALLDVRFQLVWEPLAVHVSVGPTAGWLASCGFEFQDAEGTVERTGPCADDEFRGFDVGLALGGGLEFGLTEAIGMTTGFQYTHGLGQVDRTEIRKRANRTLTLRGGLIYYTR